LARQPDPLDDITVFRGYRIAHAQGAVFDLESLLSGHGISIVSGSYLEQACLSVLTLIDLLNLRNPGQPAGDIRASYRDLIGLTELKSLNINVAPSVSDALSPPSPEKPFVPVADQNQWAHAMRSAGPTLLYLHGPSGTGKSAQAREWAHEAQSLGAPALWKACERTTLGLTGDHSSVLALVEDEVRAVDASLQSARFRSQLALALKWRERTLETPPLSAWRAPLRSSRCGA